MCKLVIFFFTFIQIMEDKTIWNMKGNIDPLVPGVHLKVPHKLQVYLSKCDLFSGHQALKG